MSNTPPPGADGQTDELLAAHALAVIAAHEHGESGGFYTDLLAAESAIRTAVAATLACNAEASEDFASWLAREMPPGTVIASPAWWAPRILSYARIALRAAGAPTEHPEPKLVLSLPDYEQRRIVIASDEVIDGERLVCVAIEDAAAGAPVQREIDSLKYELGESERAVQYRKAKAGAPVQSQPVARMERFAEDTGAYGKLRPAWLGSMPPAGTLLYAAPLQISGATSDGCKFCLGAKGGVPGNANVIGGETVCDYCTSLLMSIVGAEKVAPTISIFAAPAGTVVAPDLAKAIMAMPSDAPQDMESPKRFWYTIGHRDGKLDACSAVQALFAAPTPTTGEKK